MPWQIPTAKPIDLGKIMLNAQQYQMNKLKIQQAESDARSKLQLQALQKSALAGNEKAFQILSFVSPETAKGIQDLAISREKHNIEVDKTVRDAATQKATVIGRAVDKIRSTPSAYEPARKVLIAQGIINPEDMPEQYDQNWVESVGTVLPRAIGAIKDPDLPLDAQKAGLMLKYGPDQWSKHIPEIGEELRSWEERKLEKRGKPNVIIYNEKTPMGVTEAMRTKLFKDYQDARITRGFIGDILKTVTDENGNINVDPYVGWAPRVGKWSLNNLSNMSKYAYSKLPENVKEWHSKMSDLSAAIGKYKTNEYHKLIGGQQTAREIQNLIDTVLSMDMSSQQFKSALSQLMRDTERAERIASDMLSSGMFPLGSEDPGFGIALDRRFNEEKASEVKRQEAELIGEGRSREDAGRILMNRGMINVPKFKEEYSSNAVANKRARIADEFQDKNPGATSVDTVYFLKSQNMYGSEEEFQQELENARRAEGM